MLHQWCWRSRARHHSGKVPSGARGIVGLCRAPLLQDPFDEPLPQGIGEELAGLRCLPVKFEHAHGERSLDRHVPGRCLVQEGIELRERLPSQALFPQFAVHGQPLQTPVGPKRRRQGRQRFQVGCVLAVTTHGQDSASVSSCSTLRRPAGFGLREPKAKQTHEPDGNLSRRRREWYARQGSNLRQPA